MKENKIAVIGLSGESIFMKMDHFNQEGETVVADTYHVEYGGTGYNQALAAKRYGANVSFLTVCGNDDIANRVENTLLAEGIKPFVIRKTSGKSASACIMIDKEGRNRVVCYPGVSSFMTKDDVRLFEEEIPEIFDGTVVIKDIAREAGERSKVAVYSTDPNVDPIGACIGQGGSKIQKICSQLGKEKIDIVLHIKTNILK
jgi:sugar/nucleoside kinase (ribokinase family)